MNVPLHIVDLVTTDEGRKFVPAGRMAAAIIEIINEKGGCSQEDLSERGFQPDEVAEYWHMAQSFAAVEINLMSKIPLKPKPLFRGR